MIKKFSSYEEANFFVEEKRQAGYHAEIINEGTGFLWGPRTVGGFRVAVSDTPVEIANDEDSSPDHWLTRFLRVGFVAVLFVGAFVALISALQSPGTSIRFILGLGLTFSIAILGGYVISRYRPKPPLD